MTDVHPNPWGREYSDEEWRAAQSLYPQYALPGEREGGPLIYKNGEQLVLEAWDAVVAAEAKLQNLLLVHRAVARETMKTEFVND